MNLYLDFETRSRVDLKKAGAYAYAEDPSTEIVCVAYALDNTPVKIVPFPATTRNYEWESAVQNANLFYAHNAQFERALWNHKLRLPLPHLDKWRCSAAQAAACCLPRSLGDACAAAGTPFQKDVSARALMLRMCKPLKDGTWDNDPEHLAALHEYCKKDVEAERSLADFLPPLGPGELKVWQLDQKINDRGIPVDLAFIRAIVKALEEVDEKAIQSIKTLTHGLVDSPSQVAVLLNWIRSQGVKADDVTARTVRTLLEDTRLAQPVREVLKLRQSLSKSSTAKYSAALACASRDGRVRGSLLYYGANSGRWAGRHLQPQNFPRCKLTPEQLDAKVFDLFAGLDPDPMATASLALRSMIASPKGLTWGDFDQIEARMLAWLAGENEVLDDFRAGRDVYVSAAAQIFNVPKESIGKESDERQVGKTAVLALGYGGGIGAFGAMATGVYNVDLSRLVGPVMARASEEQVQKATERAKDYRKRVENPLPLDQAIACDLVKQFWRESRKETVALWHAVEEKVKHSIANPGKIWQVGAMRLGIYKYWLVMKLPSDRCLYYYQPKVDDKGRLSCMRSGVEGWHRRDTHGGVLVENITQALARDVLCNSLRELDKAGVPVALTVHDEIITEGDNQAKMKAIMGAPVDWARGLPIAAKIGWGKRYGK